MCGIAGVLDPTRPDRVELGSIARSMVATLAHRGPDAEGVWVDERAPVAFGHRRLAIIDLTPTGAQPMTSADGRFTLVLNGEIYNHLELRADLTSVAFRGRSDTETFVEAVAAWGLDLALRRTNGMFALAVWDARERTLSLARDRMGEKPLYHGRAGGAFVFGSELKAVRAHPGLDTEVDRDALAALLRLKFVPAPHSIVRGISMLEPATVMTVRMDGSSDLRPYWSLRDTIEASRADPITDEREAIDRLEALLSDSVRMRMASDVPLGAFLSGGIDSSAVVAAMAAAARGVRTFTIGNAEPGYDEAASARAIASALGTDHTEFVVTGQDALELIPSLPTMYDEPFADSSQIPTALVSRLAREHVTVALSGDGGDEMFGGYNRHGRGLAAWRAARRLPGPMRTGLARALRTVPPSAYDRAARAVGRGRERTVGDKIHKLARVMRARDAANLWHGVVSHWDDPGLVVGGTEPPTVAARAAQAVWDDPVAAMMELDAAVYLPGDILTKLDRASMAVGLEARVPMLDHRLVALAWRLPTSMKVRDGVAKWPLRQVLGRALDPALFERPKMGFGVPIDRWLRGPLRGWADDLLSEARLRADGYLRPEPVAAAWRDHRSGRRNRSFELWDVLMFQAWLDAWRAPREVAGATA